MRMYIHCTANCKRRVQLCSGLLLLLSAYNVFACIDSQSIQSNFSSGAAWDMCWDIRTEEGVILSNVYYTTAQGVRRKVFGQTNLAQIQIDFDDNSASEYLLTQQGMGGANLVTLSAENCENGLLHKMNGRPVICQRKRAAGYMYKYTYTIPPQQQGEAIDVYAISNIGGRHFVVQWTFYENGIIEPAVGLTGQLLRTTSNPAHGWSISDSNTIAVGFSLHYFWKLDFDLGDLSGDDVIEQIVSQPDSNRATKKKVVAPINTEAARQFDWDNKAFWRVRDSSQTNARGAFISYELSLLQTANQSHGNHNENWLQNDVYFTQWKSCERFAVQNINAENCSTSVDGFIDNAALNPQDVVIWYRQTHHYLPGDEDDSVTNMQWNKFQLIPRDWSAANPVE